VIIPRRRGKILEVPNLLDETLLREPQCGVVGTDRLGRDRCVWSGRESDSVWNPKIAHSKQATAMQEA